MSAVEGDEGLCLDPTAGVACFEKKMADLAWLCMRYHCSTATLKLNLIDEIYVDHTSYERTLRSAALNANCVSTGASVTYHLGTWNLASCKLCSSIITLYCSGQMLAMGTGSLR